MRRAYRHEDGHLAETGPGELPADVIWVDLLDPEDDEVAEAHGFLGAALPTRAEMNEIELSSRLYHEGGADYVTILVPAKVDGSHREVVPVSFVLRGHRLVTLRHHDPRPFTTYPERASRMVFGCGGADAVLLGLFEEIIDRIADILELTTADLDGQSRDLFRHDGTTRRQPTELLDRIGQIGRAGDLVTDIRTGLLTLDRALFFLGPVLSKRGSDEDIRAALEVQKQDARSLAEQTGFLSQKTSLLLDATLGVVNIEQNANIKLFSVIAVIFLPPTLIASLYGMNFAYMPELEWSWGYPMALIAMVVSAVVPIIWFRRRGWF